MEVKDGVTYYPNYQTCKNLMDEAWESAWTWVNLRFQLAEAMSRGRHLRDDIVSRMGVQAQQRHRKET